MKLGEQEQQNWSIGKALVRKLMAGTCLGMCVGAIVAVAISTTGAMAQQAEKEKEQGQGGETVNLDKIVISATTYETEGSQSYASDLVSVGEKEVVSVREIPQSTHVITREKLEDGGYSSLDTALKETPGVLVLSNDDGRSSLFSRGFEFDNLNFAGLPAPLSSIYGTQPDMAIIDHVEILRGPSGLFGGTGEPTGAINMRLKQAGDILGGSASITVGADNNIRGDVDITSPLNRDGTVRARFVGALQDKDSFVAGADNGVAVGYGTVSADITDNTTATLSISHMERDMSPFNGLPAYADGTLLDVDVSATTGANWNRFDNSVNDYIAELEHKFEDGGHAKISARFSDRDVDFLYGYAGSAASATGDVNGMAYLARIYKEQSFAADAHASKPFELFGQEHNVIVGADYRNTDSDTKQARGKIAGMFNIHDWNRSVAVPTLNYTADQSTDTSQFGLYGQLRIRPVDGLTLIGGSRFSWFDSETRDNLTGAVSDTIKVDGQFTPYVGATYDLTDYATLYGSYTTIFQPQSQTDISGNIIDPREGHQYEVGVKTQLLDDRINATAALFRIEDTNRAVADADNPGSYLAQGKVRVEGMDFELSGSPFENWEVMAGYTYTRSKDLANGGIFSSYTPKHMMQLSTKYSFDERFEPLNGLSLGAGMRAFSSFSSTKGVTIKAPGYAVFDAFASYEVNKHLKARVNVDNLFNEKYYERVGSTSVFNFYGQPRTVNFKLTATF